MSKYSKSLIKKVYSDSNGNCYYCGCSSQENIMEIDHFLSFSKYKNGTTENFVLSCKKCNRIKRDNTIEEFRLILEKKLNKNIVFFFEFYGINITKDKTFYTNTLNKKMY